MSGQTLTEGADGRATLDILRQRRSPVDVRIYVWSPSGDDWRLLTLQEQRKLWKLR